MYSDEQIQGLILNFEDVHSIEWRQWHTTIYNFQDGRLLRFALEMLHSDNDKQISAALNTLCHAVHFHSLDLSPHILPFLDNPIHWTNAIQLLTNIGDKSILPRLFAFLHFSDLEARRRAFFGIFRLGHPDILNICLHLIHDADTGMRISACLGLGGLNNAAAVEPLIYKLNDNHFVDDYCVSAAAATALGEIKDKRAIKPLMDCVKDGNKCLSDKALVALWEIAGDTLEYFYLEQVHHPYSETRETAISILGQIGKADFVDLLISISQTDPSYGVQLIAANALGDIGTPKAKEAYQNWHIQNKRKS